MFLVTMLLLTTTVIITAIYVGSVVAYDYDLWDTQLSLLDDYILLGPNIWTVTILLIDYDVFLSLLVLVPLSVFWALVIFICYHFWLIKYGITTNENVKINVALDKLDVEIDGHIHHVVENAFEINEKEFKEVKKKMRIKEKQVDKIIELYESPGFVDNAFILFCKSERVNN